MASPKPSGVTRRRLLVGGGIGVGLVLAWELWPRRTHPNVALAPGESLLDAFLKIGADGRVTVVVPQVEMGQGIWTALPQALADELGADWRQVAVEPAPLSPLYANRLVADELATDALPRFLHGIGRWVARDYADSTALMVTGGSTSIRAFEGAFRAAGANARALLCMAVGARLGADWRACDTDAGFVVRGPDRIRFGELAAEAARFAPPPRPPVRSPGAGGLSGRSLARVDDPAKVDGSLRYAGDVRLPGMVFASVRHGPVGGATLKEYQRKRTPGLIQVVAGSDWLAAVGESWWAADKALETLAPSFAGGTAPSSASVGEALDAALATGGTTLGGTGDVSGLDQPGRVEAVYEVGFAPHAAIEPLAATARLSGDWLEVWAATQAPALARAAAAQAASLAPDQVTLYPMPLGGGFGRKLEVDAVGEAAALAVRLRRPVQLTWSRAEEMTRGAHRPPAKARLRGRVAGGRIAEWEMLVATPPTAAQLARRIGLPHGRVGGAEPAAVAGGLPAYDVPATALRHAPADIGVPTGRWPGGSHAATAFFAECFVDELAAAAGVDPLSFRMGMLSGDPRLARCLQRASQLGGWSGEAGAGQGLAAHACFGGFVAVMAEAHLADGRPKVTRLSAAVDCGRVVNPEIVVALTEGQLLWGLAAVLGDTVHYDGGLVRERTLDELRLPRLADAPEIRVDLIRSDAAPGGASEIAVPPVAPAIANALAAATGRRFRQLPLAMA